MVKKSMTKEARLQNVAKTVCSTNDTGKTGQPHVKKHEIRLLLNSIHKNKLKMDSRPTSGTGQYKTPRGKHRQNTL